MTATKVARPSNRVVQRVLTDGEYVVNHSLILEEGCPAAVRFDVWRIANGVVAEHWADEERWSPGSANCHTQIDGTLSVDHSQDKEQTRKIATATVRPALRAQPSKIKRLFRPPRQTSQGRQTTF